MGWYGVNEFVYIMMGWGWEWGFGMELMGGDARMGWDWMVGRENGEEREEWEGDFIPYRDKELAGAEGN